MLTFRGYDSFIDAVKDTGNAQQSKMQEAINALPPINLLLLATVISFLKDVAALEGENKMGAENLGIVFGPTLLREKEEKVFGIGTTAKVVEYMILHYDTLFSVGHVC